MKLVSSFCVFSCIEVGNWSSRTLYELWLQNSSSLHLPPQRQIDSHWDEDAVYRNLLLHLFDNWTMLGLRKWWYWKQADDIILWWLQSMKVYEPTLWVTWRAVLRNKIGRFWTCFVKSDFGTEQQQPHTISKETQCTFPKSTKVNKSEGVLIQRVGHTTKKCCISTILAINQTL